MPLVTISLVTYNGARWLPGCLDSIAAQDLSEYELLVLDNASTDGSVDLLRTALAGEPRMRLVESTQNLGYAAAHNRLIFEAKGEFVLLLNQDVELDPSFLSQAVAGFHGSPRVAAVQGRLRRLGPDGQHLDVLDSTGLEMHRDRRTVARRQGQPEAEIDLLAGPVWGADGPAPVYRRSALLSAAEPRTGGGREVLDEDFFMYKEDVDLAWRLHNLGWEAWYEPQALAWHARGAGAGNPTSLMSILRSRRTIPRWILELSWRNQHLMQLKNETAGALLRDFPWIARREIGSLALIVLTDPRRLGALVAFGRTVPCTLRKRPTIHRRREDF